MSEEKHTDPDGYLYREVATAPPDTYIQVYCRAHPEQDIAMVQKHLCRADVFGMDFVAVCKGKRDCGQCWHQEYIGGRLNG